MALIYSLQEDGHFHPHGHKHMRTIMENVRLDIYLAAHYCSLSI